MLKRIKQVTAPVCRFSKIPKCSFASENYYGDLLGFKPHDQDFKPKSDVENMVQFFRKNGHAYSKIDPLDLFHTNQLPNITEFGIKQDGSFTDRLTNSPTLSKAGLDSLESLEKFLTKIYADKSGAEFDHITSTEERHWLYNRLEELYLEDITKSQKLNMHYLLAMSEVFDHFLQKKFETFKRYSGEGAESLIVAMNTIFARASASGYSDVVLGMPHRGRLNILVGLLDYPARNLFHKITGKNDMPNEIHTLVDDVVSHIACSNRKTFRSGSANDEKEIGVTLLHNPSHLEGVNPVSMGKTRAKQDDCGDAGKVMNVQIHGDAAFAAQGIVYEGLALSKLKGFRTGGSVHVVCNNQIGYTTTPSMGRSTRYTTCLAKAYEFPVVHVNGDSPEDVYRISKLAVEYQKKFNKDFMIDLICYRRYGHNEVDEPEFTQPLMYKQIRERQTSTPRKYHEQLVNSKMAKEDEWEKVQSKLSKHLEEEFKQKDSVANTLDTVRDPNLKSNRTLTHKWSSMSFSQFGKDETTGANIDQLIEIGKASIEVPSDFTPHARIQKFHITSRLSQLEKNLVDWATAESMALGSLLNDGYSIRFSGEDVERGTFSQRHLGLTDSKNEKKHYPLKQYISKHNLKSRFDLVNSPLSENAVMAFEYGYSIENPMTFVLWEAQFGDFFNTAQQTIDTFISCSEAKWMRQTALTMLLPHGFDGAGPEHSSCRIERFLQLASTDGIYRKFKLKNHEERRAELKIGDNFFYENSQDLNFHLVNPSTPANYFHLLRRQMLRNYRKPLVVAAPKQLLRHAQARSKIDEMGPNTSFKPIISSNDSSKNSIKHAIICSGKVGYDISAALKEDAALNEKVDVIRVEEILPFPEAKLKEHLTQYSGLQKVIWFQEEPYNAGAFSFAEPHISRILLDMGFDINNFECIARRSIATPATGVVDHHKQESKALFETLKKQLH